MKNGKTCRLILRAVVESIEQRTLMSAGMFDPTLGTGGQTTGLAGAIPGQLQNQVIAEDSKGRVLIADSTTNVHGGVTELVRLTANGQIDKSFGANGTFSYGGVDTSGRVVAAAVT